MHPEVVVHLQSSGVSRDLETHFFLHEGLCTDPSLDLMEEVVLHRSFFRKIWMFEIFMQTYFPPHSESARAARDLGIYTSRLLDASIDESRSGCDAPGSIAFQVVEMLARLHQIGT